MLRPAVHTAPKSMLPFQTIKAVRLHAMDIQCISSLRQLDALRISVGLDELAITNENATSIDCFLEKQILLASHSLVQYFAVSLAALSLVAFVVTCSLLLSPCVSQCTQYSCSAPL